jgi:hypothetical protein
MAANSSNVRGVEDWVGEGKENEVEEKWKRNTKDF